MIPYSFILTWQSPFLEGSSQLNLSKAGFSIPVVVLSAENLQSEDLKGLRTEYSENPQDLVNITLLKTALLLASSSCIYLLMYHAGHQK